MEDCTRAPLCCIHRCKSIFLLAAIAVGNVSRPRNSLVGFLKFLAVIEKDKESFYRFN